MRLMMRSREESGASAVEYGLLVAGIAALIIIIAFSLGGVIKGLFDNSCGTIAGTIQNTSCDS